MNRPQKGIKSKFITLIKNKKGFSNLELAIGTLIIILILCAVMDFSRTTAADSSVSTVINYVAETISEQGGLSQTPPSGYIGTYTTPKVLISNITDSMNAIGVPRSQWSLQIKSDQQPYFREVTEGSNFPSLPYKSNVEIVLNYHTKLDLLNQNLPGKLPDLHRKITRRVITTYFDRTSSNITFE